MGRQVLSGPDDTAGKAPAGVRLLFAVRIGPFVDDYGGAVFIEHRIVRAGVQRYANSKEIGARRTVRCGVDIGQVAPVSSPGIAALPCRVDEAVFRLFGVEVVTGGAEVRGTRTGFVNDEGVAARCQSRTSAIIKTPEAACRNVTVPTDSPSGDSSVATAVRPTLGWAASPVRISGKIRTPNMMTRMTSTGTRRITRSILQVIRVTSSAMPPR